LLRAHRVFSELTVTIEVPVSIELSVIKIGGDYRVTCPVLISVVCGTCAAHGYITGRSRISDEEYIANVHLLVVSLEPSADVIGGSVPFAASPDGLIDH
jgi:hypothetical protein